MSSIIRVLSVALVLVLGSGCAVATGEQPDNCEAFTACSAESTALIECNHNGQCACSTSHPGENRAASCDYTKPHKETETTSVN